VRLLHVIVGVAHLPAPLHMLDKRTEEDVTLNDDEDHVYQQLFIYDKTVSCGSIFGSMA
jgi:hypothetical protein